jgi:hypothetical protein
MTIVYRFFRFICPGTMIVLPLVLLCSAGCAVPKHTRVAAVASTLQDVAQAAGKQSDPTIIKEGTPAFLMLLDGLIEVYPDNRELLVAGTKAYTSYGSMFLADTQPDVAEAVFRQAKVYGFRALSERRSFSEAAAGNLEEFKVFLQQYQQKDVPALFWTASAWAGWISCNPTRVEALGDLPVLEATLRRLIELDGKYFSGGPHLLMGMYLAASAKALGGSVAPAKEHFDKALAYAGPDNLATRVAYAQYYAVGIKDRQLFVRTLKEVTSTQADAVPELTLSNVMAKNKARRLLERTEEYFGSGS